MLIVALTLSSCSNSDTIEGSSSNQPSVPCMSEVPFYGLSREELVDMKWPEFQQYQGFTSCAEDNRIEFLEFVIMRDSAETELLREAIYADSTSTMKIYDEMDEKLGID